MTEVPPKRRGPVVIDAVPEAPRPDRRGPVMFESGPALEMPAASPETAPPVPEPDMQPPLATALAATARGGGSFSRAVWAAAGGLVAMAAGVAAWDFVMGLLARNPVLGWAAAGLAGVVMLGVLGFAARELAALSRLARIDRLQGLAREAREKADLTAARTLADRMAAFYAGRHELDWGLKALAERRADLLDADALLDATERHCLDRLDAAALAEIETAARQVAVVTAMVPLALADVAMALTANVRMIRRIAAIYGGRAGSLGSWRLVRAVSAHLVATGALAVGDDLIGSALGGGVLAKLSRRFGEGVLNAGLTARVGVAAIEVCRPMPHRALPRPAVTGILRRAVAGMIPGRGAEPQRPS